jgi:VCBS repeat-containing protein
VIQNDKDVDADDLLSVNAYDQTSLFGATITMNADGSFQYDPTSAPQLQALPAGQVAFDEFDYEVTDLHGAVDSATVRISVTGVNDGPTADDDVYQIDEDHVLQVDPPGVLDNDIDVDGDPLQVLLADATSRLGAIVNVNNDGSFTYDPTSTVVLQQMPAGDRLVDRFGYTAVDVHGETSFATVVVDVTGVNDAPHAVDDLAAVPRNEFADVNVVANDDDLDGTVDPNTVMVVDPPIHGSYLVLGGGIVRYTPDPDYSGDDSFTYTVRDEIGAVSAPATVTLNINGAPLAVDDDVQVFINSSVDIAILDNDTDVDGTIQPGTVTIQDGPFHGNVVINPDGTLSYSPLQNYFGSDTLTYTVVDDDGAESNEANVSISVIIDPFPWQNPRNALDVNDDTFVTAIDALLIINDLNFNGPRTLPNPPVPANSPPPYYDTNADGDIAAIDALLVINHLNEDVGGGEGEAATTGDDLGQAMGVSTLLVMSSEGDSVTLPSKGERGKVRVKLRGELSEEHDDRLRIGRMLQEHCAAIKATEHRHRFDPLLDDIAEDICGRFDDGIWEDLADEDWRNRIRRHWFG